jgi:hypothetical protein
MSIGNLKAGLNDVEKIPDPTWREKQSTSGIHNSRDWNQTIDGRISISWESVYKISRGWLDVLIYYGLLFGVVMQWIRQRSSTKFCANLAKSMTETVAMIRQAFGEEILSRARKIRKNARQAKNKIKSMLIIFFVIKEIVHKEFILAGLIVMSLTTVTFYGDCVKMCESFASNFGDKTTGCCVTTTRRLTLPFSLGSF